MTLSALLLSCARDAKRSSGEGYERESAALAPSAPDERVIGKGFDEPESASEAADRGQKLLFIYPRLSKRLRGEIAEPMSEPRELVDERGRIFMLGVRVDEGTPIELDGGHGISQTARLDLYAFEPEIERETLLYRFTLRLNDGPEFEPTDDLLIARSHGGTTTVTLERRALNEAGTEIESEGQRVEAIGLAFDAGDWKVERLFP